MQTIKRLHGSQVFGLLIDVQDEFLNSQTAERRDQLLINLRGFVELLAYFRIPYLATLERPIAQKGALAESLKETFAAFESSEIFEKDFFDLTKHREIMTYLRSLKKRQVLVAGSETDVCVLQSVLGLMEHGYEVYVVEDLIFSSSEDVRAALDRLRAAGATFVSLKTVYYELLEAVESSPQRQKLIEKLGPFPASL